MPSVATPTTMTQPRIVTLQELKDKLIPIAGGDKWGLDTITDLWLKGAPIPNVSPNQPVQRILLPRQFEAWFNDVQSRRGLEPDAAAGHVRGVRGLRGTPKGASRRSG